ncbi:hypothetical protein AMJ71_09195 [candidate division TA06 bacterium SM1_40]|uniref:Uncharacterized protein n=1 Tax=candidate division TA06 bacterium SM1_40 TaxID=1703773 RepID=A0A0S8JC61_UNCT6|nr:MAG: hypothetical protein AMJ71_09195 [candidate division TA06 bacterium SM1_40]
MEKPPHHVPPGRLTNPARDAAPSLSIDFMAPTASSSLAVAGSPSRSCIPCQTVRRHASMISHGMARPTSSDSPPGSKAPLNPTGAPPRHRRLAGSWNEAPLLSGRGATPATENHRCSVRDRQQVPIQLSPSQPSRSRP